MVGSVGADVGETLSCFNAIININGCDNTNILCNGDSACANMKILSSQTASNNVISITCGETKSCDYLNVTILGNPTIDISCFEVNACDDMNIKIDSGNYKKTILNMYSYSNNIRFNNGFGFQEVDGDYKQYITCNTRNTYIEYPTSNTLTQSELETLVLGQYENDLFPCDGIQILCYTDNASETTSSCQMERSILNNNFNIDVSNPSIPCYWVPIDYFIRSTCRGDCLSSPTESPTSSPTDAPSVPTEGPTSDPTRNPTMDPSSDPTADPSVEPTMDPTGEPTGDPTGAPSAAPSRAPTQDVDLIYDVKIEMEFTCHNLTEQNKENLVKNTSQIIRSIIRIIEANYFDASDGLTYEHYWVLIYAINGVNILQSKNTRRRLPEYDYVLEQSLSLEWFQDPAVPTIFGVRIECDDSIGEIITGKTTSASFKEGVQKGLRDLFNNQGIVFETPTDEELATAEKPKFTEEAEDDLFILYVSVIIAGVGVLTSLAAWAFNKLRIKGDNAKWFRPCLVALGVYDFISDINLSIQMWNHDQVATADINRFHILALLGAIFILLPFCVNMYFAVTINSQDTIHRSPSARSWFGSNIAIFIILCVCCAGTYPVLGLTSSRIFGLELLNAGLLSSDLEELSKIKIKSTILMENLPQLGIQLYWRQSLRSLHLYYPLQHHCFPGLRRNKMKN